MKTNYARRLLSLAFVAALSLKASAAVLNWTPKLADPTTNDCVAFSGVGGTGTWEIATNWTDSADCGQPGSNLAWVEGSDAQFWDHSGTITLGSPHTVSNMTFNVSGYNLSFGTTAAADAITLSGTPTVTVATGTATITTALAGTGGYNVAGAGKLKLNNFGNTITGPISIPAGATLELAEGGTAIGGTSGNITINGGTLQNDDTGSIGSNGSGDLLYFANGTTRNVILDAVNGGTLALGATSGILVWPNGGNSHINGGPLLLTAPNGGLPTFQTAVTGNTFSKLIIQGPACFKINAGTATDDTSLGALPAVTTPDAIVITNGGVLQFNNGIAINAKRGITVGASATDTNYILFASGSASANINSSITGPGPLAIQNANGGYFNGSSSGLVNLNASNSWSVATIMNGGILVANNPHALPYLPLIFNPTGSGAWTGNRLFIVTTNVTVPSLSSGPAAGATSTISMRNGGSLTVDGNTDMQFAGVITDNGNANETFIKSGTSTMWISNKWSATGTGTTFRINQGTIAYGNATAGMPSGNATGMTIIAPGATLDVNGTVSGGATIGAISGGGSIVNATNITLNGTQAASVGADFSGSITPVGAASALTHSGSGTQTLSGNNNLTVLTNSAGRLNLNSQTAAGTAAGATIYVTGNSTIGSSVSVVVTNPIAITSAKTLTVVSATNSGSLTLNGVISGAGGLLRTTADGGPVTLNGNNTFTGGVNVSGFQLNIGSATALGTGIYTNNGSSAALDNTSGSDLTIANTIWTGTGGFHYVGSANDLTLSGTFTLTAGSRNLAVDGHTLTLTTINENPVGGGYSKVGAGTAVLNGPATYTGATVVSAGTLAVNCDISTSSGVTVNSGGTLAGTGTVPAVTLNSGGTISAGVGVGALASGAQTWNGGSTNQVDMSDANGAAGIGYDSITMSGALTIAATPANPMIIKIAGTPANFPGAGSWTIASASSISGFDYRSFVIDSTGLTATLDPNKAFRVSQSGNNLVLTYSDPAITIDPANTIVSHTSNAVFNVTASGASLSYQWQKNGVNVSGGNITGATTSSLTVGNVADSDVASYSVVVTDSTIPANVTSASATLDIVDAPSVTVQPASQTVGAGTNATLVISWNGSADDIQKGFTTFKWQTNGVNVAGAHYLNQTTTNLTVVNPGTANAQPYTIVLSNLFGTATSSTANLGVDFVPTISSQPTSATISPYGGGRTNSVGASGGDLSYQWWFTNAVTTNALVEDPLNYIGTMTANLVITNGVDTNSGGYFCIITNYAGSITSSVAVITVPVDPVVASSPASRSAVTGTTTIFAATVSGKPNLFYHWKKDGVNLVDDGLHIIGANTATLTLANVSTADTASSPGYVLEVTNDFDAGFANSTAATLTVFDTITIGNTYADGVAGGRTYTNGNQITLTAPTSSGTAPFTYQWKKGAANVSNGANITGSTTSSMTIASAGLTDAGSYSLVVNNFAGAVTSAPPAIVVIDQQVVITSQPSSVTVDVPGHSATFTVGATGNPLAYQWYFNSNAIAGANSASYTIPSVTSANIGYYHVVVNNLINSATSQVVTLKIGSTFFSDDLTGDTHTSWNVFTNRTDGLTAWAFDYSLNGEGGNGPGIPQNPNTTNSTALQVAVNYNSGGIPNAITLVPKNCDATGDYQLSFDVFMNLVGSHAQGPQTAQSMTAGLGCTGATTNLPNGFGLTNNGVAISADDDEQTEPVYVMYSNANATTAAAAVANSAFVAGTGNHTASYYTNVSATPFNFPTNELNSTLDGATGQTQAVPFGAGTFGLQWHHVVIKRSTISASQTNVTWSIDGHAIGTVTNGYFSPNGTNISIGLWANFTGGATTNWQFSLFNNIRVESFSGAGIAPTIVTSVADTTANAGSTATLTVSATSPTALRYQWQKNGNNISGATDSSYSINAAYAADNGTYSVTVYNDSDFVSGGSGVLTVIDPAITAQPADTTVECGSSAILSVTAAGTGTLTYQWYTPDANGTAIPGATSATLTVTESGVTTYAVVVTGSSGTATSSTATVTVEGDCGITITGQPQNQLKQPQGTNVALTVTATGAGLTYQWYENNVLIPGATGATNSFVAHTNAITGTNLTYYVVVSNAVTSVQSSSALVTVLKDIIKPALIVTAPLNNTRAQSFTVKGKTTDTHGNDAKLKYFWTGITTPGTSPTYSIDISGVGIDPTKRDFTGSGFALTNPPSAGTNTLTIWVEDLAGNASSPAKVVKVFWQVPHTYALTISGDGTGSVKVSTKGAPQEVVAGAPTGTLVGSANTVYNMSLYAHQVYSIKYTPDPKLDHPTAGTSIASVVSNAVPVELAGTTTTRAQTVTFTAGDTDTSANVSFARNRFVDMAGTYNGVFTGLTNVASSRLFVMTISPTRTVSGYLMDATKTKTTFTAHQTLNADGSGTIVAGGITISGSLAWTGSEDPNGVKEFIGSATDGSWTAALTAEKADKTALPTEGFATMQIPGGFGGSGFATVHSKNGTITAIYTLADDDKHAVSFAMMGNRSKNIPQWITSTHSGGLLFGNLIVDDGLTNLSAPALSWIRPSGNLFYPALLPAGFTNSPFAAVCSPFLAGSKLNGTYTLNITGGGLANDITSQTVTFTDSKMTAAGKVKVGLMDPFGKLKFTFQDGTTPTHTTIAVGALLQNATNGVGFFIKPLGTDAGNVSLTPQ